MLRAVDMGAEVCSLFGEFAVGGKREHLEAAGVGENRAVPAVELVKASGFAQQVGARTQVQVVGIAQDYLGLDIVAHLRHQHPFDSAAGAYGHENRGFDFSVAGGYQSGACVGAGGGGL